MTGRASRRKGADAERAFVRLLKDRGIGAERMWQHKGGSGIPDVLVPGFWAAELKARQVINVRQAMQQAREGALGRDEIPLLRAHYTRGEKLWVIDERDGLGLTSELHALRQSCPECGAGRDDRAK